MAVKKVNATVTGTSIQLEFADGEVQVFDLATLGDDMKTALLVHGGKQKIVDSFSGVKELAACRDRSAGVWEALTAGKWTTRVAGEGGPRITLLAEAIAKVQGLSVEDAREKIELLDEDTRKAVRAHPQIKAAMADIKAERARVKADEQNAEVPELGSLFG